jgi:hypothetical protein
MATRYGGTYTGADATPEAAARRQAEDMAKYFPTSPVAAPKTSPAPAPATVPIINRSSTAYEKSIKDLADVAASRATIQAQADAYAAQQRQARIDAINTTFAPRIKREEEAGAARMARVAALNFKQGIVGSGVDTTKTGAQENLNKEALQSIEDAKATAINEAFGWADQLARQRAEDQYSAATRSAEANVSYQKNLLDTAIKTVETMGKGGASLESLKVAEPETYKNIVETTGLSDLQLASMLNANSPQPSSVSTRVENGYLISSYFDPQTKKFTHVSEKLPEGVSSKELAITQGDDGVIYAIDKVTGKVVNSVNASKPTVRYDSKDIPKDIDAELRTNASAATLPQLYEAYPDVDQAYIEKVYRSIHPVNEITRPF